ncbi:YciI family protein [Rothia sp. CCM 9419]|uniref:YciI family protein n=1 Tax=Rothia sp. CCM 9419 TaxID=3402662 RepID=UPI003ADB1C4D
MSIFICTYSYAPAEEQEKHRPEHRLYLGSLVEKGIIIASGPYVDNEAPGAMLLFKASSADEVREYVSQDPMYLGGAVLSYNVREWNPVLGSLGS